MPEETINSELKENKGEQNFSLNQLADLEQKLRRHKHNGLETEKMNEGVERVVMSFETGEQSTLNLYIPFSIRITKIRGRTIKAIAATDDGTITVKDNNGNTMATLTASASTAINTDLTAQSVNSNNLVTANQYYQLISAKTTAGGEVMVSIEYERI